MTADGINGNIGKNTRVDLQTFKGGLQRANLKTDAEKSIFDTIDTDKNGVLTQDEIKNFQQKIDTSGDNEVSKKEADNYLKSNNLKKTVDKKELLKFLQEYNKNTEDIEDVSVTENAKGKTVQIKYKDGTIETLNPDKTSKLTKTGENEVTTTKFLDENKKLLKESTVTKDGDMKEIEYAQDGETITKLVETKNNNQSVSTTSFKDGKPESKEVKSGITSSYYSYDEAGNEVLNSKVENEGIPAKEKRTEYKYNKDGTVTENITQYGKASAILTKDGKPLAAQIKEGDKLTNRTYYEKGYSDTTTDAEGNTTITDSTLDGHRLAQKRTVGGKEHIVTYDGAGNTKIVVQNGETLSSIAKKFKCSEKQLVALNSGGGSFSGKNLKVGTEIKIPGELDADAQPLQGRKSADETIADFRHDQAVRDQKRAQAMARDAQYKAMGLTNHKGQGTKITGKYKNGQSEEFVVIGEAGRKRHLAKDSKGNFVTIAHDGTVLKEEYVTATNLFDKGEKVDGSMKIRQKNGKTVTINKKFVKVGTLEKGRSAVIDEKGRSYVMAQDGRILDSNFVVRDRQADVLRKDAGAARTATLNMMSQQIDSAQAAFDKQMEDDGWAGDVADGISVLWGSKNRASKVREDLKQYKKDMAELNAAAKKGDAQFKTKFKQMFGVDYNQNAVANYYAHPTSTNYQKAFGTKNDIGTRVAKYNESQQTGAAVVKTTTKVAAGFAVAAVTGGTGLVALGAAAVATGAASVVVEESDRLKIGQAVTQGKFEFREGTDHAQIFKNAAWDAGAVLVGGGVGKAASTIVKGSKVVTAGGQTVQALTKTQKLGRAAINVTGDLAYGAVQEKVQTGDITVKGTVLNGATALVGQAVQSGVAVKLGNKVKDAVEGGFSKGKAKISDTAHKFAHTKSSAPAQQAPSFKTTIIDPPTSNVNYKVNPDADATVTKIIKNYEPDPVTTIDKNMFKLSNDNSRSLEMDIPQMPKYTTEDMVKVLDDLNKATSLSDLKDFTDLLKNHDKLTPGQQNLLQKHIDAKRRSILGTPSSSRVASTDVREVANSKRSSALQNHQTIELNSNDKIRLGDTYELDLRDPKVKAKINSLKPGQSLLVGRSRIADIQIDNKYGSVSRTHLVIENINGKLYATDLTSTNGTTLNNSMLRNISAVKGAMVRESVEKYVDIEKDDLMES